MGSFGNPLSLRDCPALGREYDLAEMASRAKISAVVMVIVGLCFALAVRIADHPDTPGFVMPVIGVGFGLVLCKLAWHLGCRLRERQTLSKTILALHVPLTDHDAADVLMWAEHRKSTALLKQVIETQGPVHYANIADILNQVVHLEVSAQRKMIGL